MSTYTPISSFTATTSVSSVTLSGIPQTYTDLVLVTNWASSNSLSFLYIQFNSDTGSNYSFTELYGNGSAAGSYRESNQSIPWVSANVGVPSTIKANTIMNFMNYSNSTTYKTWIARMNSVDAPSYPGTAASVGLWRSTNAITTITLKNRTSGVDYNFASGSTFNLYGIDAQASAQAKATGGSSITRDANYWYHTFYSSGTFTPTVALTADYLVVAGGGGGGKSNGGGGGAGGLRCTVTASGGSPGTVESALSLTAQAYTVTVGGGGAGGSTNRGTNGTNSVFSTITSDGGGGGGSQVTPAAGLSGGSGGGGAYQSGAGGSGTANQGFAGGTGDATNGLGGSGGGASAVGGNANYTANSPGGAGVATSISGSSVTYAGGGGQGGYFSTNRQCPGGAGGGGKGGGSNDSTNPDPGSANTGGGGGGGYAANNGAAGGSGIVIIRYAV